MTKIQNFPRQRGFTIIEVLLSLGMIAVMLLVYQVSLNTLRLNEIVHDREIALRIANNKIETMRATPYSSLPTSGTFTDPLLSSLSNSSATLTITDFNDKTKNVKVIVTWQRPGAQQTNVTLETLITQGGV